MIQYDSQEQFLYYEFLHQFFSVPEHATIFIKIIKGESMVTLRQIEHFLKKYSLKHRISYYVPHPLPERPHIHIYIHDQYMEESKLYTTKKFDIFCRHVRVQVPIGGNLVETNIAQLNMFQWIITNGVIEYMENHHAEIVADMYANSTARNKNKISRGPKTSKRPRLTCLQRIVELPAGHPALSTTFTTATASATATAATTTHSPLELSRETAVCV